jgi:membrane protease YdiL (CAAX protease family)
MAQLEASPVRTESAWRLIGAAVGWMVLAFTCGAAVGLLVMKLGDFFPSLPPLYVYITAWYAGVFVTDGVLFAAAVIHGRIVGSGNINAGLGNKPVSRSPLVVGLAVVIVAYAVIPHFLPSTSPLHAASPPLPINIFLAGLLILSNCLLEPAAEESLFRGWLWTGLQRHWGALPTALLTSTLFLAVHFTPRLIGTLLFTPRLVVTLVPVAIILAVARHFGQSVRASFALHVIYNLAVKVLL